MAFFSEPLRVVLATVHLALRDVFSHLSGDSLVYKAGLFYETLRQLGIESPRLAVCALNPHASEEGLFGHEEAAIIRPAVRRLKKRYGSRAVSGPHPADTLFRQAAQGDYDGVVALYHDQALIPLKLLAFESAINTTLGLPLVRTSPDHGTAFDIAGQGRANCSSMVSAIRWGIRLARQGLRPEA